ncbi:MAG TPA: Xaa-Pro peptidase family protein [Acidimicrobiales bacterium]|nr:Xaa-Pro peptidase family protein [Acidimicrobiales bacterium]
MLADRADRIRARMAEVGVDVLLLSVGPDLPYLTGYEAMPLERLTMLVLPREGDATLVVPRLEAPRVTERPDVFTLAAWDETDDPVALVAGLVGAAGSVAIGDRTWARFVLDLQAALPGAAFRRGSEVVGPLRAVKDPAEVESLRKAAAAADRVASQLHAGDIPLVGRTEAEVSADIGRRLVDEGHQRVNFAIVAAGAHAASPHHEAGERVIEAGDVVLCDFGGTMLDDEGVGYCSDITRCVSVGEPSAEVAEAYAVLHEAQHAAVAGAVVGVPCEEVDAIARRVITEAGYGEWFIHRTGHGIGVEEHEDPYIVAGNRTPLAPGHAFSVEPGIYVPGRFGLRLEDIVVAAEAGPDPLNRAAHELVVVDA